MAPFLSQNVRQAGSSRGRQERPRLNDLLLTAFEGKATGVRRDLDVRIPHTKLYKIYQIWPKTHRGAAYPSQRSRSVVGFGRLKVAAVLRDLEPDMVPDRLSFWHLVVKRAIKAGSSRRAPSDDLLPTPLADISYRHLLTRPLGDPSRRPVLTTPLDEPSGMSSGLPSGANFWPPHSLGAHKSRPRPATAEVSLNDV